MPAVVVDELTIRYGDRVAVDGLSFVAAAGEVLVVLGANGAGKTSTVECLEGFRAPTAGRVRVLGLDPIADHRALVAQVGVMLQEGGVAPTARPEELLTLYAAYYDQPTDPLSLLDRVGLGEVRRSTWHRMSGGERQRLSLALALVGRPRVAFLDEPTAGVDAHGRQVIREIIAELRADGVCVVLTTHELDDAERIADRILIMHRGRHIAEGTLAELTDDQPTVQFRAPTGIDVGALGAHLGAAVIAGQDDGTSTRYEVAAPGTPELVADLTGWLAENGHTVDDLRTGGPNLESIFLALTTDAAAPAGERAP